MTKPENCEPVRTIGDWREFFAYKPKPSIFARLRAWLF
jgi:hypothetical protein